MARTAKQRAASRKNLEKARRAKLLKRESKNKLSGGTSKFVSMGTVGGKARIRRALTEKASVVRHYKNQPRKNPIVYQQARRDFETYLIGGR